MKAILEFNLPEDSEEYLRANTATDMASTLWDIASYLRSQRKYGDPPDDIEKIVDKFYEIMGEHGINLDRIYT